MAKNQVTLTFAGDTSSLERAFGRVGKETGKLGGTLKTLGKVGAVAGFAALAGAAKVGFDEFMNGQKVAAQTAAVLKSTGGAAGVTAGHVSDLAGALMKKTSADDDAIASSENLLLTFTNIKNGVGKSNQIFDQATATVLDMSQALGQDGKTSAIQLGKALNDPIKGVSALSKIGVTFTQGQKDSIKAMMDSGNVMGAQKVILAELSKEVGGSAEAYGKTLPGQIDLAKNTLSNFAGNVVGKVVPVLANVVTWISAHWPQISATFTTVFNAVRGAVQVAIAWIKVNVVPVIQGIIAGVKAAWDRFGPIVKAAFDAVVGVIRPALNLIKSVINTVMALLRGDWSKVWDGLKGIVSNALKLVIAVIKGLVGVFLAEAKALGKAIWDGIKAGLAALAGLAGHITSMVGDAITTAASWVLTKAAGIGQKLAEGIWNAIKSLGSWLKSKIEGWLGGIIDGLKPWSPVEHGGEIIGGKLVKGTVDAIVKGAGTVKTALGDMLNWAVLAVTPAALLNAADLGKRLSAAATKGIASLQSGITTIDTTLQQHSDDRQKEDLFGAVQTTGDALAQAQYQLMVNPAGSPGYAQAAADYADALKANTRAIQDYDDFILSLQRTALQTTLGGMTKLAAGGIVTKPTLALIGERGPEAVVPLSRRASGNTYNITINAWDTRDGATAVVRAIDEFERRNGQRYARA